MRELYVSPSSRSVSPGAPTRTCRFAPAFLACRKQPDRDRLIIDARPGNSIQGLEPAWLATLASAANLTSFELGPDEELWVAGADIKDFYHNFLISGDRSRLYRFVGTFAPSEVSHLKAFLSSFGAAPSRRHSTPWPWAMRAASRSARARMSGCCCQRTSCLLVACSHFEVGHGSGGR